MLQFIAGAIVGWTSARILPPPSEATERLSPPTLDEIQLLASKTKDFIVKLKEKLDEESTS